MSRKDRKYVTLYRWDNPPVSRTRGLIIKMDGNYYEYVGRGKVPRNCEFGELTAFIKARYDDKVWRLIPETELFSGTEATVDNGFESIARVWHIRSAHHRFAIYMKPCGESNICRFPTPAWASAETRSAFNAEKQQHNQEVQSEMSTAPNTSRVVVNAPAPAPQLTLNQIAAGSYFKVPGSNNIFIKSDEWLGSGYRCMNIVTGELTPLRRDSLIEILYTNVNVTVS